MKKLFELTIELIDIKPKIWRKFEINPNIDFNEFHKTIQTVMGWENRHLFDFLIDNIRVIDDESEFIPPSPQRPSEVKAGVSKVIDYINKEGQVIFYHYDMGDYWRHKITVDKIFEVPNSDNYSPVLISGQRACPPEDCGGVDGYMRLVKVLKKPNHELYEELREWVGNDFDPDFVDLEEISKILKRNKRKKKPNSKPSLRRVK